MVFGSFHHCACCERAAPDAPETIDDQRRCTGWGDRTIYGGSRGSASLPAPAKWLGPITPTGRLIKGRILTLDILNILAPEA